MADPVLQVRGLNVYYGHSHALQGVDLTLEHGVLSVVGRNGMGKTTLCQAICGLKQVRSGTITFAGRAITNLGAAEVARMGIAYVPAGPPALAQPHGRRAPAPRRPRRRLDHRSHLLDLPPACRAQDQRWRTVVGW